MHGKSSSEKTGSSSPIFLYLPNNQLLTHHSKEGAYMKQCMTGLISSMCILGFIGTAWGQSPVWPPQQTSGGATTQSAPAIPQTGQVFPAGDLSLPPSGEAGKCYARVWEPATYGTVTEKMLAKEASQRIELIPAKYEWVEEKVLVRAATQREQIIPATYKTVTDKILVKPATTRWVKGRGLIEQVNNFTGEIMCLKEFPAEYRTVSRQVLTAPANTQKVQVPAEYQTVKVRKLISAGKEKVIPIPAEYQTVTKTVLNKKGRMAWRSVQCETNAPAAAAPQVTQLPAGTTSIQAQPASQGSGDNWFFFWKYDELFDDGQWQDAGDKDLR